MDGGGCPLAGQARRQARRQPQPRPAAAARGLPAALPRPRRSARSLALVLASAAVLSLGIGLRYLIDGGFSEGRPDALNHAIEAVAIVIVVARGRDLPALLPRDLAGRAGRGRPAPRRLPPRAAPLARLLRGHPHRRGAVAPDHRHQRDPDRDRRQRHPGAAQPAAGRGRPGAAGGHQPAADRLRSWSWCRSWWCRSW